ncbi:hypothetical protein CR513_21615, partial [Mucuna pruriens]
MCINIIRKDIISLINGKIYGLRLMTLLFCFLNTNMDNLLNHSFNQSLNLHRVAKQKPPSLNPYKIAKQKPLSLNPH